ncbi:hypothetical protein V7654_05670 [Bacillus sp. JJ1609]
MRVCCFFETEEPSLCLHVDFIYLEDIDKIKAIQDLDGVLDEQLSEG